MDGEEGFREKKGKGRNDTNAVLKKFSKNKTTNCFKLYMKIEIENKDTSEQKCENFKIWEMVPISHDVCVFLCICNDSWRNSGN